MQHSTSLEDIELDGVWLSIGSFDGVHRGHQEIVQNLTKGAQKDGAKAVVLTFHPHPAAVLGKRQGAFYLTTPEDKANLLGKLGVDLVITHTFDLDVAHTSARDFVRRLNSRLGLRHLVVGFDFALGWNREGNIQKLEVLGQEFNYTVHTLSPFKINDEVVSSSLIRKWLSEGNISGVEQLLGRPFGFRGRVVPGDGRGRLFGIRTANLEVWKDLTIPAIGVYVCRVHLPGNTFGAVTNIGFRPTFDSNKTTLSIETHLLNFNGDLYGESLEIEFLSRLRDEKKFLSMDALITQIHQDIESARLVLSSRLEETRVEI